MGSGDNAEAVILLGVWTTTGLQNLSQLFQRDLKHQNLFPLASSHLVIRVNANWPMQTDRIWAAGDCDLCECIGKEYLRNFCIARYFKENQ